MSRIVIGTTAIDIDCPTCGQKAGARCPGDRLCQARVNAAARATREANRRARERS